jgi:hypothetical protein
VVVFGVFFGVYLVSIEAQNRVHSSEMVEQSENGESYELSDFM